MALSTHVKADVLLVIVTLLAAVSWIFSKEAIGLMPPLLFMACRFLIAGALLAALGWRELSILRAPQWLRSIRVGLVFAVGMSCWIMGLESGVHVGEGAFLTSLGVVLVPVMAWLIFDEAAPRSTWVSLPIACAGLALLFLQHELSVAQGQLWFIVAAVIFALFFILNTRASNSQNRADKSGRITHKEKVPPLALTAIVLTTVGVVTCLLSLLLEPWLPAWEARSYAMVGWVLASAVIGSSMRFLLQTYAQSLSNHSHGVVIMVIEPVWTALLAAAWLGETMTGLQLLGCSLILMALLISRAGPVGHRLWRAVIRPGTPG
jgi:drug/metabolite transporter (DMT)-like permease